MHTIGVDMSKNTFHAAFDDITIRKFDNTDVGIIELVKEMESRGFQKETTLIGVESTGVYHLLLCQTLKSHGWKVKVINPLLAHRMFKSSLRYAKTDRSDASTLRRLLENDIGYEYSESKEILVLKTLVQERDSLVRIRAGIKQRIHTHIVRQKAIKIELRDNFSGALKLLSHEIYEIEKEISKYARDIQKLLLSIPGIGKISAASLVAYVGDIKRFPSPKQLTAYIGLDARVFESGTSVHGKGYMTKRGNRYLRYILFNAAFKAIYGNPELKQYFDKKISEGKHYFSAMCAVERKLVHIIYAVWKRGTPFK